jgi:hypothetical protein
MAEWASSKRGLLQARGKEAGEGSPLFVFEELFIWGHRKDLGTLPCSRQETTCAACHSVSNNYRRARILRGNAR